jgi:hypothetical protein
VRGRGAEGVGDAHLGLILAWEKVNERDRIDLSVERPGEGYLILSEEFGATNPREVSCRTGSLILRGRGGESRTCPRI